MVYIYVVHSSAIVTALFHKPASRKQRQSPYTRLIRPVLYSHTNSNVLNSIDIRDDGRTDVASTFTFTSGKDHAALTGPVPPITTAFSFK